MKKLLGRPLLWSALSMMSAVLIGPALSVANPPPWAQPPSVTPGFDATLYEATETMVMQGGKVVHRKATSALIGLLAPGTPLCPMTTSCTVTATGSDDINMGTGLGKVKGTFYVVVQGDNPVDSPEFIMMSGKFSGKMDFSPAVLRGIPYGTITGEMVPDGSENGVKFTGTFRLPANPPEFNMACLATSSDPFACITAWGPPSYLTDPAAFPLGFTPVNANEFALGYPTVRFDIKFGSSWTSWED
jgi:hypothetical protein